MAKDLDKLIEELTNHFREELKQLKEEGLDDNYVLWLKEELRDRLLVEMNRKKEEELKKQIEGELKKCKGEDIYIDLLIKVDLIQQLVYQILLFPKQDSKKFS